MTRARQLLKSLHTYQTLATTSWPLTSGLTDGNATYGSLNNTNLLLHKPGQTTTHSFSTTLPSTRNSTSGCVTISLLENNGLTRNLTQAPSKKVCTKWLIGSLLGLLRMASLSTKTRSPPVIPTTKALAHQHPITSTVILAHCKLRLENQTHPTATTPTNVLAPHSHRLLRAQAHLTVVCIVVAQVIPLQLVMLPPMPMGSQ